MTTDDKSEAKGYRAGWILVALACLHVVAFWAFNHALNGDKPHPGWDLDDVPIVPASSIEADGYYFEGEIRHAP